MNSKSEEGWNDLDICQEKGYYTNGYWLLLADEDIKIPKKASVKNAQHSISAKQCDRELMKGNGTPTAILYFAAESPDEDLFGVSPERIHIFAKGFSKVVFRVGDGFLVVNQGYYNVIANRYKDVTWRATEDLNAVVAYDDLGPVGVVAGISWDKKKELLPCETLALEEGLMLPGRSCPVDFSHEVTQ